MSSGNGNDKVTNLPKLLSSDDLAELLGDSPAAFRRRRERGGNVPSGTQVAGRWVYCRSDVERWLHEQQHARSSA
jgi:hypothetical protein